MATGIDTELKRLNTRQIQERDTWLAKAATTATTAKTPAIWPTASLSTSVKPTSTGFLLLQCPNSTLYTPLTPAAAPEPNLSPRCYNCQETSYVFCDCLKLQQVLTIKDIKEEEELAEFKELADKSASQGKAKA